VSDHATEAGNSEVKTIEEEEGIIKLLLGYKEIVSCLGRLFGVNNNES